MRSWRWRTSCSGSGWRRCGTCEGRARTIATEQPPGTPGGEDWKDPLDMARIGMKNVQITGWAQELDPTRAFVARVGQKGADAAWFAACAALVSIAGDVRRIADALDRAGRIGDGA